MDWHSFWWGWISGAVCCFILTALTTLAMQSYA